MLGQVLPSSTVEVLVTRAKVVLSLGSDVDLVGGVKESERNGKQHERDNVAVVGNVVRIFDQGVKEKTVGCVAYSRSTKETRGDGPGWFLKSEVQSVED